MKKTPLWIAMSLASGLLVSGCSNDDNRKDDVTPEPEPQVAVFAPDGKLDARIRRTTYGVPHIEADNIESLAFGSGYAQAQDHLCLLADGVIKANSERSKYFGPHKSIDFATGLPVQEDNQNLVNDFGYKALGVREAAVAAMPTLGERSRAMLSGFAAGYNLYLADLASGAITTPNLPCAGQPWVKPITDVDMLTYLFSIALLPGAANFLDLIFFANPGDGDEYLPRPAATALTTPESKAMLADVRTKALTRSQTLTTPQVNPMDMGSNGWGLGAEVTDNGKGMVLGNPHFPHTGQLRFWQSHLTIPGFLDVMGGSLVGMPGAVNIGFNHNLAWTHTFSTAEHFIMYNLALKPGDRLTYLFDEQEMAITPRTYTVEVNIGGGVTIPLEKEVYLTAKGPMVEAPPQLAPFGWDDSQAFFIQDANMANTDVLEHWSAMNFATNLEQFQQAFKDFDGVIFNNTMYADDQGNAFYIDDSTVPGLSSDAENAIWLSPDIRAARESAGFTILPGDDSMFAFDAPVAYDQAPKLLRQDFVQNSNNSYWITNPASPIENVSPLYGDRRVEQSLRTRMALTLMNDARGDDGKFSRQEVEAALMSNRAYLAELVLPQLLEQCEAQGSTLVVVSDSLSVDVSPACAALAKWNGAQNQDSVAGALLREFGYRFDSEAHLDVPFVYTDPLNTPNTLAADGSALVALAAASATLTDNGFALDAPLGSMQFVEKSMPDGSASGARFPWAGANNREGGFNVFAYSNEANDDTLLPQHAYPAAVDAVTGAPTASELTTEGYHVRYGSSWMMVVGFEEQGPQARGLLTYSESNNALSPHWNDQTQYYSQNTALRPLLFTESAIAAETLSDISIQLQK
ncbi:acylase [Ferrimonas sp. SCSIO 43195]|uniref:acylase n=1 Tax=Ferrimonas sp. SCSIO 43195 TaxID=2822844 RepID=UPI0020756909|nr:acylase [Ferrimonas sp. SCSIO 43195]USD37153.1 acylase [Ferrimonas sp. SCSIO 43195]